MLTFTSGYFHIKLDSFHLVNFVFSFQNSFEQWRPVFFIGASVYIISAVFFIFFGTGDTQPWNYPKNIESKEKDGDLKEMNGAHAIKIDVKDVKETPLNVVT